MRSSRTGREPNLPDGDLALVLFSFDLDMVEAKSEESLGIQIVIVHRYSRTELCAPGEEIVAAYIVYKGKSYWIPLSTTNIILLDYLCRHRGLPQTAAQIARGLSTEPFYQRHAANAQGSILSPPRTTRTAVKEQIMRLRVALRKCFITAQIPLSPEVVLASDRTSGNEVRYRIRAVVRWEH